MARAEDENAADTPADESFAARLKKEYGDGVDPEVSLDRPAAQTPSGASSELLRRLADHGLKQTRYRLEGEVARGGMGAILKVWDEDLRRTLAMKVILGKGESPTEGGTPAVDPRMLARFLEEAQVTGQLDHPGIVPVHELGLDSDGRVYFTMKLVKGRDLKQIFDLVFGEKEGWNETRALGVMLKVCEAMAYAHAKGVIHRDLKPANVMVGNFGEAYVMDWGLARVLGRKDTHDIRLKPDFTTSLQSVKTERREEREESAESPIVTMDGDVMGTPSYMPPEQARGEIEKLSARSDVYAIGAMLYHLLARQMPYVPPGARVSNRTVLLGVVHGPPKPVHEIHAGVPAELVAICEKAMSRDPSARYLDTLALAEDLRAYLEHRVVAAYETGAIAEMKKWVARNKPLAASFAAALLIAIGGLSWVSIVQAHAKKEIEAKNEDLTTANVALDAANKTAQQNEQRALAGEALAKTNAELAEERRMTAEANEEAAKREKSNVLRLSAFQTLDDLTQEADALWPAEPSMLERYRAWMARAETLVAKIPEFRGSLVAIVRRALAGADAERQTGRQSDARLAGLEQKCAQHLWLSRMLGEEAWPSASIVKAELSKETLLAEPYGVNELAWRLVDPEKPVYGSEVKALLLVRWALALSSDETEQAAYRDTLAWALYRLGRFDDAIAEERRALAEVDVAKKEEYEGYVVKLEAAVNRWRGDGRAERVKERDSIALEVAELAAEVSKELDWRFAEEDDRWWYAQMEKLIAALKEFADDQSGLMLGISAEHGWGVAKRIPFAASIEERSVTGAEATRRWSEAIDSISYPPESPLYEGLVISPQLGLLPIGRDPDSGLWEFAHLQTGEPAVRGTDGRLVLTEETGLVFVLIPGGTFGMGAQRRDRTRENYDPQSSREESPVHEVTLSPYFLSKYEMTQGQWMRVTGRDPSQYSRAGYSRKYNRAWKGWSALHPVEQVDWTSCMEVLGRLGCELPTEARWERGARAGTSTVYWTGDDAPSLAGAANLSDSFGKSHGTETWSVWEKDFDDGNTVHAAVGSYRANAFGLHDVHGNVWEWCRDGYANYSASSQLDPLTPWSGARNRSFRGGSFNATASYARSAQRGINAPEYLGLDLGLRPAMSITTH